MLHSALGTFEGERLTQTRWTIADVDALPQPRDDTRYEIIAGELFVSTQPHYFHQSMGFRVCQALNDWGAETGAGEANWAVGVIFDEDEAVAPDVVWIRRARIAEVLGADGKLHAAPDLVAEILSPGRANERRDREAKLDAYSRRGVLEYWIVDWPRRQVEVYRRQELELRARGHIARAGHDRVAPATGIRPTAGATVRRHSSGLSARGAGSMRNEFTAVIEPPTEGDPWFIAYCPEIPGANGQGRTMEEARGSLVDGIALMLEVLREGGLRGVPPDAIRTTVVVE